MARSGTPAFDREPLRFLDSVLPTGVDVLRLPGRQLLVADAAAARSVLTNDSGLYLEHSDFFHLRRGQFGPRPVQVEIGRGSRKLLHSLVQGRQEDLARSIRDSLQPSSEWPDAGNWLMYRHLVDALRAPDSPPHLIRMLDEVVRRAALAGARERYSFFRRLVFRRRVMRVLAQALQERRRQAGEAPSDLLDVVARATSRDVSPFVLAELYLGFVFAIAGSVGFTLGWSLYLLGTHPPTGAEPAWVVREALRLWPVAWLLARRPIHSHQIGGVEVTPRDKVLVCPYAVHRHPRYWKDPASFQPERWEAGGDQNAYIPFGWGPHTCVAASLSLDLVRDAITVIRESYEMEVRPHTTRPYIGPALAPPRFTLGLRPTRT